LAAKDSLRHFFALKTREFVKNPQKRRRYFYALRGEKTKKTLEKCKFILYNNKKVC
jgi:hypothetical protein